MDVKQMTVTVDVSPEALGSLVTEKAWSAANWSPVGNSQTTSLTWMVLAQLPEETMEWYRDAFEFFNNTRMMNKIAQTDKMGMKAKWDFPQ